MTGSASRRIPSRSTAITVPGDPMTAVTLTHVGIPDDATRKVNGSIVAAPTVQQFCSTRAPVVGDTFRVVRPSWWQ